MADNTNSNLEKIKLQAQENEAKLKEKREQETAISNLNKAIRETMMQTEKSAAEQEKLTKSTDLLGKQKLLEECRRDTLSAQLDSLHKQLRELRAKCNEDTFNVWKMRSSFCQEIHSISDVCDVWALLMKPCVEPASRNSYTKIQMNAGSESEDRLQTATERRSKAAAERDRLSTEPDSGEEFIRIKNALRYALDKIDELNK